MVDNLLQAAGFALLIAFAYLCWPPAALLVAGLVLLVVAQARSVRRRPAGRVRLSERLARVLAAYRAGGGP